MAKDKNEIIVAVDFSSDSAAALLWACEYAVCVESQILVLHVVHDLSNAPGFYRQEDDAFRPMKSAAEDMMENFLDKIMAAHPEFDILKDVKTKLLSGLPPGRIVEVSNKRGARILVLGSRGNTGLEHILLGSVAERVVETSTIPTVIVKNRPEQGEE